MWIMSGYPDNRRIAIKPYVYNAKKRFYGRAEIDPIRAKMDFTQIVDEVVAQFTPWPDTKVTIKIDIEAEDQNGFDENLQRAIRENCAVLEFDQAEFEGE